MPRDSNCDYLAFVVWVETKAALREMIPDHAVQHAQPHPIHAFFGHHSSAKDIETGRCPDWDYG
jgi:hypothetical protein